MARKRYRRSDYVTCKHCQRDFRAITVFHLRSAHGYDGDHPVNDYKHKFRLRFASCPVSRKKISEAKDDYWGRRGQHWTRAKLLAEIRRIRRAGRSLRRNKVPVRLYEAGRRLFKTWEAAVEKAGFDYEEATGVRRWSQSKVVAAIRELAERRVPLDASYVERHYPALFTAAVKQFPRSWRKALRAAGFDPDEHKKARGRWDRPKAVDWVRERARKRRSLLARDAARDLRDFVRKRLGKSWTDFIESLGIRYPGIKKRRDWTRAKVLAEIRRWKAEGHPTNYAAVKRGYQALLRQSREYFRSWDRARAAARVRVLRLRGR